MENKEKELLPIGSVVLLKNGTKRIMIIGYFPMENGTQTKYDYSGTLYPEGLIDSRKILLFNNDQIEKICFKGLIDEEQQKFQQILNQIAGQKNT